MEITRIDILKKILSNDFIGSWILSMVMAGRGSEVIYIGSTAMTAQEWYEVIR